MVEQGVKSPGLFVLLVRRRPRSWLRPGGRGPSARATCSARSRSSPASRPRQAWSRGAAASSLPAARRILRGHHDPSPGARAHQRDGRGRRRQSGRGRAAVRDRAAFCWASPPLAALPAACRARPPARPAVDWSPGPGTARETAALLWLDQDGMAKLTCLPGRAPALHHFPKVALRSFLDVGWRGEPVVAGAAPADGTDEAAAGELVLLAPGTAPRRLATGVRAARFSPDARALAYEVARPGEDGGGLGSTSYVLDSATNELMVLGALTDLRWEADGEHLRATRLRTADERADPSARHWASLRVRWNRTSRVTTADGPGSAQIPAPAGEGVACPEHPPAGAAPIPVRSSSAATAGSATPSWARSAWASPTTAACAGPPTGALARFPASCPRAPTAPSVGSSSTWWASKAAASALSALRAKVRPQQLAIAAAPASLWFDWSPS